VTPAALPVPQNPEAEESVLGAIMLASKTIDAVRDVVRPADFYRDSHARIYRAALALRDREAPIDVISLAEELRVRGDLDRAGGKVRLSELLAQVPAASNARHHAILVAETARRRDQQRAAGELERASQNGGLAAHPEVAERLRNILADFGASPAGAPTPDPLQFVSVEEFAAGEEASGETLMGAPGEAILAADGTFMAYGDGGAGKTTLQADAALHLASGTSWLGFDVPRPVRVALIENEGPRGMVPTKLAQKIAGWNGASFAGNVHVLEEPWAAFSLANAGHCTQLADFCDSNEIDLLMLGPVASSGMIGAGTPDDIEAHAQRLTALRRELAQPLAIWLTHHENKAGDVSGAWERLPDTLLHVRAGENGGVTLLHWRKVRWGPSVHGSKMTLRWLADTAGYELVDAGAAAAKRQAELEEATEWLKTYIAEHPGAAKTDVVNTYAEDRPKGARARIREAIDNALEELADAFPSDAENGKHTKWLQTGPGKAANGIYLYPATQTSLPLAAPPDGNHGNHTLPLSQTPQERESLPLAAAYKEAAASGKQRAGSPEDESAEELERLLVDHADIAAVHPASPRSEGSA
jgi:hypothetical protein